MRFVIHEDRYVVGNGGKEYLWVEQGSYPLVRFFDKNRVMIQVNEMSAERNSPRLITIVPRACGEVING